MAKAKANLYGTQKVDLAGWTLDATDGLEDIVLRAASEAINIAMKESAHVWFPAEWDFGDEPSDGLDGNPPADPMTLYIQLPLGHEDSDPTWTISLAEVVDCAVECSSGGPEIGSEHVRAMTSIRDGFLALAQKITDKLPGEIRGKSGKVRRK